MYNSIDNKSVVQPPKTNKQMLTHEVVFILL